MNFFVDAQQHICVSDSIYPSTDSPLSPNSPSTKRRRDHKRKGSAATAGDVVPLTPLSAASTLPSGTACEGDVFTFDNGEAIKKGLLRVARCCKDQCKDTSMHLLAMSINAAMSINSILYCGKCVVCSLKMQWIQLCSLSRAWQIQKHGLPSPYFAGNTISATHWLKCSRSVCLPPTFTLLYSTCTFHVQLTILRNCLTWVDNKVKNTCAVQVSVVVCADLRSNWLNCSLRFLLAIPDFFLPGGQFFKLFAEWFMTTVA